MLQSINLIKSYITGMNFEAFAWDQKTVDAVVHNLGIIGEAAGRLPESVRQTHADIPWDEIRGLRNIVIHEYFGVSKEII